MKTATIVIGFVLVGIALADLATGDTGHSPLPNFLGDHLTQQTDLALGAVGAGALWLGFAKL